MTPGAISWLDTLNWLRLPRLPCSTTRVPAANLSASQGWLNQTALMTPDSSATVASTIDRPRRLRRRVTRRTSAITVASSPGTSDTIGLASRRSS